ncbi:MAG: hypothetical protein AB1646_26495 [Thermodesulfobacteriota bacterium]
MLPGYAKKTNIGIGLAIIMWVGVYYFGNDPGETERALAGLLWLGATVPFVLGCCAYAKGKGYESAWGILGLFCWFGLLVLALFPDRHRQVREAKSAGLQTSAEGPQHTTAPGASPGGK